MSTMNLKFDIYALAQPKTRQDCIALTQEILARLEIIEGHIDAAIARCEAKQRAQLSAA